MSSLPATATTRELDEQVLLHDRVQQGLWIFVTLTVIITVGEVISGRAAAQPWLWEIRLLQLAVAVGGGALLSYCRTFAQLTVFAVTMAVLIMMTSAVRGIVMGDVIAPPILAGAMTLGVAGLFPWPRAAQASVGLLGITSILINTWTLHGMTAVFYSLVGGLAVGIVSLILHDEAQRWRRSVASEVILRRRAEEASRVARDAALRASEFKSNFVSSMSHEVRNPVGVIAGLSEIVLDGELAADQRELVETIHRTSLALARVINEVLDLSKIEAGKVELHPEDFEVRQVFDEIDRSYGEAARRKGLEFSVEVEDQVPHRLLGDQVRLRQVLVNLVSNAVKFTDSGEIRVVARQCSQTPEGSTLECMVQDTGPGISPEEQGDLFAAFSQAGGARQGRFGGSGLGLAICKQLVELMHGSIELDSVVGAGTSIRFTVRLALVQPE